jgi:acetyltransferase-like isoleucine patch superfamily enzyme
MMAAMLPWIAAERLARRLAGDDVWFEPQAEWMSLVPGRLGVLVRAAFYHLSLAECPLDVAIQFGALVTHSRTVLGHRVYIGMRTTVGWARIGDDTLLADQVQVLSGARHHQPAPGDAASTPRQATPSRYQQVEIGSNCWVGAQAVVMASVGDHTTVGAGSIVTRPLPPAVTAVGNPARVIVRAAAAPAP